MSQPACTNHCVQLLFLLVAQCIVYCNLTRVLPVMSKDFSTTTGDGGGGTRAVIAPDAKQPLSPPVLLAIGAVAMDLVSDTTDREPWELLFDATDKLDKLFSKPAKYQKKMPLDAGRNA